MILTRDTTSNDAGLWNNGLVPRSPYFVDLES
jgi:hypothetical protein